MRHPEIYPHRGWSSQFAKLQSCWGGLERKVPHLHVYPTTTVWLLALWYQFLRFLELNTATAKFFEPPVKTCIIRGSTRESACALWRGPLATSSNRLQYEGARDQ